MSEKLLLIEDDRPLALLTAEFLRSEGFLVSIEHRGDQAAQRIRDEQPAVLILDVMLPGQDGFSLCREIRADYPGLILMMTALDENAEQLVGFDVGADDYVVKPIDPLLLLARIRALLRRQRSVAPIGYEFGAFKLDAKNKRASLNETPLPFSAGEFELLAIFSRQPGVSLTREKLLQQLRGLEYDGFNRSIDMRVSRLRKKLVTLQCPVTIQSVPGQGYLFVENETPHV